MVYLDRIFLLAEPATLVEGGSEDAVQEAKRNRIRVLIIETPYLGFLLSKDEFKGFVLIISTGYGNEVTGKSTAPEDGRSGMLLSAYYCYLFSE